MLLLTLCMLTGAMCLPAYAEAEAEYTDPDTGLVYDILTAPVGSENGTVKLRTVDVGRTEPVTAIPAVLTVDGADYDVVEIAPAAFVGQTSITQVDLPKCERIGAYAFEGCTGITRVRLAGATVIDRGAFQGCTALEALATSAETIHEDAFEGCVSLASADLPNVVTLWNEAFSKCESLTEIRLPMAETIWKKAFYQCSALTVVELPKAESLFASAFSGCSALISVDVPKVESLSAFAFSGCSALVSIDAPKAATLDERVFDGCSALEQVNLPAAKTLGDRVFNACLKLTALDLPNAESLGAFALNRCESLTSLSMPNAKTIGARALGGCEALTELTLGETAPTLANAALGTTSTARVIRVPEGAVGYDVAPFTECTVSEVILPGAEIYFYTDAEYSEELPADTILPVGTTVYYEILCFEGIFCPSVLVDGTAADRACFTVTREAPLNELLAVRLVLGGDLDESGALDNRDATALLRHMASWQNEIEFDAADYNRDAGIDNRDVTMMLRYLADWYDTSVTDAPATIHTVYTETAVFAPLAEAENDPWEVVTLTGADALTPTVLTGLTAEDAALAEEAFDRRLMKTATVAVIDIAAGSRADAFEGILSIPEDVAQGLASGTAYRAIVALKDADEAKALADASLRASLPETTVFYSDFSAVGDGVTDDFAALKAAHTYANEHGYPVRANPGATYYIGIEYMPDTIKVQTDTDWTDAEFIIDDTGIYNELPNYHQLRQSWIFEAATEYEAVNLKDHITTLAKGTTTLDLGLGRDAFVLVQDSTTKTFIKTGMNMTSGETLNDCFILHADGTVDEATPIIWDFDNITSITAYPMDDPLTLKGGTFTTIANQASSDYYSFYRGINVKRSNVTVDGVKHYVTGESTDIHGGAPYLGFINFNRCANSTVQNTWLTGRRIYESIGSAGVTIKNGSYDLHFYNCASITVRNCTQTNDILSGTYWGLSHAYHSKDLCFEGCSISRIDAHMPVTNETITDCVLGYMGVYSVGGGTMYMEDTTFFSEQLLWLRDDIGSSWDGDIIFKDCLWAAASTSLSHALIQGYNYGNHDYGYACTMPHTVTIDGLYIMDRGHSESYGGVYILGNFTPDYLDESYVYTYPYELTERVTVKNFRSDSGFRWNGAGNTVMFRDTEFIDLDT